MTTTAMSLSKRLKLGTAGLVITASIAGCQWTQPAISHDDTRNVHDVLEPAPSAELWLALARSAKAGSIESTDRLAQIVVVLGRNGEFSDQDLTKFDAVFPEIAAHSRKLTDKDIQSLIQLGQVEQR